MSAAVNNQAEERRLGQFDTDAFWHLLSLAQKVALNKLNQYGYQLAFAREMQSHYMAFACCDGRYATIDVQGEVDLTPALVIRH
jgi:hypothetical protein